MAPPSQQSGLIVANYGRHFLVESASGERRICHSRGKKSQGVVGDRVWWLASQDEGTIEKIEPRRNLFYRQDEVRTKSFAANLDQVLILIAAEPEFSSSQLSRALIAAEEQHITPIIALNKRDLTEPFARAWAWLAPYRQMGYDVLPLAMATHNEADRDALLQRLSGKTTLVLGPSGAGKSTLINRLIPGALAQTGELSQALNSGKHTTTSTTWYWLNSDKTSALLDSPGFQEFGLNHIDPAQLAAYMPDLKPHVAHCKFYNCSHLHEPGCGVMAAVESASSPGEISANRYKIYSELYAELKQIRRY
ncbi:ribosome small subunit-dependent GTPase A [Rhodoferax fermentans]|uniref:Small ribosomal subunit biogenesis GTPase RsgA n=1 Tax=Rhodoferax fermentans TaxID=28066 RepID=A0A1T1AQ51_RHOFE|nr:ribosome small subunit-dependent GTPase A [Rhodoferax fermentans]MBK1683482.1 ribosome small subunit-dependent GTPase A [Rhodoferax fermentans]OOV06236.1 ribosome small subunit-dependent GTPase A [Rhodoferax fermentans]